MQYFGVESLAWKIYGNRTRQIILEFQEVEIGIRISPNACGFEKLIK